MISRTPFSLATICTVLALSVFSCKKRIMVDLLPPPSVYFQFQVAGHRLPDSILSEVICYYYNKGEKIDTPSDAFNAQLDHPTFYYLVPEINGADSGICALRYLTTISVHQGVRDFYLLFPNGDIDTLYIAARKMSSGGYSAEMTALRFNGMQATVDPMLNHPKTDKVYVFNKTP